MHKKGIESEELGDTKLEEKIERSRVEHGILDWDNSGNVYIGDSGTVCSV